MPKASNPEFRTQGLYGTSIFDHAVDGLYRVKNSITREGVGNVLVRVGLSATTIGLSAFSADLTITNYVASGEYSDVLGDAVPNAKKTSADFETTIRIAQRYLPHENVEQLETAPEYLASQNILRRDQARLNRQAELQSDRVVWELGTSTTGAVIVAIGLTIGASRASRQSINQSPAQETS
jgi:hypothetical protein